MRSFNLLKGGLLAVLLILGSWIVSFYWTQTSLDDIVRLPMYIKILFLIYVLVQMLKRMISKSRNWWDWLYYVGLITAILPTFFAADTVANFYNIMTDVGTPFLVIPVLLDFYLIFKQTS